MNNEIISTVRVIKTRKAKTKPKLSAKRLRDAVAARWLKIEKLR